MRLLPTILLFLAFSPPALAWSTLGHRLVGALAERHLRAATEREVRVLLVGEPEPTLAGVANWADHLRNSDPDRFKRTARWHYVNISADSCDYDPVVDCAEGECVVSAIQAQRSVLADHRQPREIRRDALKFLVHLVGDVHQPLHAGNHDDRGGNQFQVSLRTDLAPEAYARNRYVGGVMGTNLHAVWDYYILAATGLDEPHYMNRLTAMPWPPVPIAFADPATWAGESCRLVGAHALYPQRHIMDRNYLDAERPLAEQRIRQAAYRLARLLDTTLGPVAR